MRVLPFLLASACAMQSPLTGPGFEGEVLISEAEGPFVAVATHTRIARGGSKAFGAHIEAIQAQLETQPGFVASGFRAELFGRERWTLTVWEDEASLLDFVVEGAHLDAMVDSREVIDGVVSTSWSVDPEQMPDWDLALDQLAADAPEVPW